MKVFNDEAALALATLSVDQLVRTKGSANATDGQTVLWRIDASGTGITLANGNVAIALVNDKSGRKNLFFNGNFDIWQRGAGSFTGGYAADRLWTSGFNQVDRNTDVPTGTDFLSKYSARVRGAGASPAPRFSVELLGVGKAGVFAAGQFFTISGWVKADVGLAISVVGAFQDTINNGTNAVEFLPATQIDTATGGWQKVSHTFQINVLPNATNIMIDMPLYIGSGGDGTDAYYSQIQLEKGTVATEFEYRPIVQELAWCQRYYELVHATMSVTTTASLQHSTAFKVTKRTNVPTVVRTGNWISGNEAGTTVATINGSEFLMSQASGNTWIGGTFTAEAEL